MSVLFLVFCHDLHQRRHPPLPPPLFPPVFIPPSTSPTNKRGVNSEAESSCRLRPRFSHLSPHRRDIWWEGENRRRCLNCLLKISKSVGVLKKMMKRQKSQIQFFLSLCEIRSYFTNILPTNPADSDARVVVVRKYICRVTSVFLRYLLTTRLHL